MTLDAPATKRCARCTKTLPRVDFYRHKTSRDGLDWWCKGCHIRARKAAGIGHVRTCAFCHEAVPDARKAYSTCSRNCSLQSVGLPPNWDVRDLSGATEQEIRNVLDSVILAASADCRKVTP